MVKVETPKPSSLPTSPSLEEAHRKSHGLVLQIYQNTHTRGESGAPWSEFPDGAEEDASELKERLTSMTVQRNSLLKKVDTLEDELRQARDECGILSRRCKELESEKREASLLIQENLALSQGVFRRNQMLERKLLEHADAVPEDEGEGGGGGAAAGRSRTEEWVLSHRCMPMEYDYMPEMEGSLGSSAWGSCDGETAFHLNPDDSASNEGVWQRIAVGSGHHPDEHGGAPTGLERMIDVSKRMCANVQNRADKVARSPWKTSVDVNPVFGNQMLFGRLMGGLAAKAAAGGVNEDALSREAFY